MNKTNPRPTSERDSEQRLAHARQLISQVATRQDWINAWQALFQIIQDSPDWRARTMAMRLLCEYRFGKPYVVEDMLDDPLPAYDT